MHKRTYCSARTSASGQTCSTNENFLAAGHRKLCKAGRTSSTIWRNAPRCDGTGGRVTSRCKSQQCVKSPKHCCTCRGTPTSCQYACSWLWSTPKKTCKLLAAVSMAACRRGAVGTVVHYVRCTLNFPTSFACACIGKRR